MYECVIEYFEHNKEGDVPTLASKLILKVMQNYNNIQDKIIIYNILNLARNYLNEKAFDDYNEGGQDVEHLSGKKKHEVEMILMDEFIAN